MSGVSQIAIRLRLAEGIAETAKDLKSLMKKQKKALSYAKVQALYLLKIKAVETIRYLAVMMGRSESTIYYWLQLYREGGIDKLLEEPWKTGRPKKLDVETVAKIQQELADPEGFISYKEIQTWLLVCQDLKISYSTIHRIVRYELKSKLKVARPQHEKQAPGVIEVFKEYLPQRIEGIVNQINHKETTNKDIVYWCQDETRIGFRTETGRKITRQGVKPQQTLQWHYDYYYIYGLIEPITGRTFFYEFSHFNSTVMGIFLEKFQQENKDEIHIIQLDNAPIHICVAVSFRTARKLKIPDNIILLFQPPYCPEVNPIERVWEYVKYRLRSQWFIDLDDVKDRVAQILNSLSTDIIISLTRWECFTNALSL